MSQSETRDQQIARTVTKLRTYFEALLRKQPNFYGSVKVNFHDGDVPHVNVEQSVKL